MSIRHINHDEVNQSTHKTIEGGDLETEFIRTTVIGSVEMQLFCFLNLI